MADVRDHCNTCEQLAAETIQGRLSRFTAALLDQSLKCVTMPVHVTGAIDSCNVHEQLV